MNKTTHLDWVVGIDMGDPALAHAVIDKPYQREVENKAVITTRSLCDPFGKKYTEFWVYRPHTFAVDGWASWMSCRDCLALHLQQQFVDDGYMEPEEARTLEEIKNAPVEVPKLIGHLDIPIEDSFYRNSFSVGMPLVTDSNGIMHMKPVLAKPDTTSIFLHEQDTRPIVGIPISKEAQERIEARRKKRRDMTASERAEEIKQQRKERRKKNSLAERIKSWWNH